MFTLHSLSETYSEIIYNPGPNPNIIRCDTGYFLEWGGREKTGPGGADKVVVTTILRARSGGLKISRARLPRTEYSPHLTLTKSKIFPLLPKRNHPANGAQNVQ